MENWQRASCVRTGESWYMADDGRGVAERELSLWWLRVCRGLLSPPSRPFFLPCWTWAQGGRRPGSGSRFSMNLDGRRRNKWIVTPTSWSLERCKDLSSFSCTEQVFALFFPVLLLKLKGANTFVALWHDRWGCQGLKGCSWCLEDMSCSWWSVFQTSLHVVSCHLCWWGFSLPLGLRITHPSCLEVAYKGILFFSHARVLLSLCMDFLGLP